MQPAITSLPAQGIWAQKYPKKPKYAQKQKCWSKYYFNKIDTKTFEKNGENLENWSIIGISRLETQFI